MWIWRNSNNSIQEFVIFDAERCAVCGQYFRKGEKGIAAVIPQPIRGSHPRLTKNLIAHCTCWQTFVGNTTDDNELAERYIKLRIPRPHPMTDEEQERLAAFKAAAIQCGFSQETQKPHGVRMKQPRTSIYIEYNVYRDHIDINHRGKRGLFDGLFERQITANIYNKMHAILNDRKRDEYSIEKVMDEAKKNVDKMFH